MASRWRWDLMDAFFVNGNPIHRCFLSSFLSLPLCQEEDRHPHGHGDCPWEVESQGSPAWCSVVTSKLCIAETLPSILQAKSEKPYEAASFSIPTLQTGKQRHREAKSPARPSVARVLVAVSLGSDSSPLSHLRMELSPFPHLFLFLLGVLTPLRAPVFFLRLEISAVSQVQGFSNMCLQVHK